MPADDRLGPVRALALVLATLGVLLGSACSSLGSTSLTREEIDRRAQEYFQRGSEQYQRGQFRPALDNFRLAKAYDLQDANPAIADMIEKTESRLRLSNSAAASGLPPPRPSVPDPGAEAGSTAFRSRLYPYSVQVPENWRADPATRVLAGLGVELLAPPGGAAAGPNLATLGTELAPDVDTRGFVEAMRKALKAERIEPIEIGKRSVDGNEATLMRATVAGERGKYVSSMAMFSHRGFGWLLIFTAAPDQSERLQPLFHRILDSFRMSDSSKVL